MMVITILVMYNDFSNVITTYENKQMIKDSDITEWSNNKINKTIHPEEKKKQCI
jgi:hypothetical protein